MTYDVVCAGTIYLDMTFAGLAEIPRPGAECWAEELYMSPGGMANAAVGLARLELRTAVVSPIGRDLAGRYLRAQLESDRIACEGPETARTAITAVLPLGVDRAMVSFAPNDAADTEALVRFAPRAVVLLIDQLCHAPSASRVYAVTSHAEVYAAGSGVLTSFGAAHALLANEAEALAMTNAASVEAAALALCRTFETAVVTLGRTGALAAHCGALERVPAIETNVRDATGAGDLFAAGYIWADLQGLPLVDRLRWATLYASLSLHTVTAYAGAARLVDLLRAGERIGLRLG